MRNEGVGCGGWEGVDMKHENIGVQVLYSRYVSTRTLRAAGRFTILDTSLQSGFDHATSTPPLLPLYTIPPHISPLRAEHPLERVTRIQILLNIFIP